MHAKRTFEAADERSDKWDLMCNAELGSNNYGTFKQVQAASQGGNMYAFSEPFYVAKETENPHKPTRKKPTTLVQGQHEALDATTTYGRATGTQTAATPAALPVTLEDDEKLLEYYANGNAAVQAEAWRDAIMWFDICITRLTMFSEIEAVGQLLELSMNGMERCDNDIVRRSDASSFSAGVCIDEGIYKRQALFAGNCTKRILALLSEELQHRFRALEHERELEIEAEKKQHGGAEKAAFRQFLVTGREH